MELGQVIKTARKNAGLTQSQLAEKCGFALGTIQQYESGKRQPRIEKLAILAQILGVNLSDLIKCIDETVLDYELWDDYGTESMEDLITNFSVDNRIKAAMLKLNIQGRQIAAERVEELSEIPKYQRDYNSEPPAEPDKT